MKLKRTPVAGSPPPTVVNRDNIFFSETSQFRSQKWLIDKNFQEKHPKQFQIKMNVLPIFLLQCFGTPFSICENGANVEITGIPVYR